MAEINHFARLEPRPRDNDFERSLAAPIRDPLWFLSRQWQIGEFQGTDGGSMAFVETVGKQSQLPRWIHSEEGVDVVQDLDSGTPLETETLREPFEADLSMRVEMGQDFSDILADAVANDDDTLDTLQEFQKLPLYQLDELIDNMPMNPVDPASKRFMLVCGPNSLDGYQLYVLGQGVADGSMPVPPSVPKGAATIAKIEEALAIFVAEVREVFGDVASGDLPENDPKTWQPENLEYSLQVVAEEPSGNGNAKMDAYPDRDGEFDWYSFDVVERDPGASEAAPQAVIDALVPTRVHFQGMPPTRFWNFEDSKMSLPSIEANTDDLLKNLVADQMLHHTHDWYLLPFEQDVGTLFKTESLVVHDTFGKLIQIKRADTEATAPGPNRFTMFSITDHSDPAGGLLDGFMVPPSPGAVMRLGSVLEDVRFARDEMANLAWGVERITTSPIGEQRLGRERNAEIDHNRAAVEVPGSDQGYPLTYKIESEVPVNWIPLLPVLEGSGPSIALERGVAEKDIGSGLEPVPPLSAILNRPEVPYRINEEQIPRSGVRVERVVYRTRWTDGSSHLWVQRRRQIGAGESNSGLLYDRTHHK